MLVLIGVYSLVDSPFFTLQLYFDFFKHLFCSVSKRNVF